MIRRPLGFGPGIDIPIAGLNILFPLPAGRVVLLNNGAVPLMVCVDAILLADPAVGVWPVGTSVDRRKEIERIDKTKLRATGFYLDVNKSQEFSGYLNESSPAHILSIAVVPATDAGAGKIAGGQVDVLAV